MEREPTNEQIRILIEHARPEHIEGMQEVFYRAWLATYPNEEIGVTRDDVEDRFKDRNSEEKLQKRRSDLLQQNPNLESLVALDGTKVVGLVRASKNETENRLNAIYVLPEYQGRGIGTSLWNEAKVFFDPSKPILVGVATYNKLAIDFYARLGFVDTGRRYTEERLRMKSGTLIPEMDMLLSN